TSSFRRTMPRLRPGSMLGAGGASAWSSPSCYRAVGPCPASIQPCCRQLACGAGSLCLWSGGPIREIARKGGAQRLLLRLWDRCLAEARPALGLLEDDGGIVGGLGAGRFALVHHARIG